MADQILNHSVSNFYTEKTVLEKILKNKTGKDYSNYYKECDEEIEVAI